MPVSAMEFEGPDGLVGGEGAAYGIYDFVLSAVKRVWMNGCVSSCERNLSEHANEKTVEIRRTFLEKLLQLCR